MNRNHRHGWYMKTQVCNLYLLCLDITFYLEYARMMLIAVTFLIYFPHLYVFASVLIFAGLLTFYFSRIERSFRRLLYQRAR